jgi:hypothetical protein
MPNVMVTILAFIVLAGGTACAASQLAKNSVGTKQLKKNAVNGSKVKDQSLTGKDINLAKLGTVPSATSAVSATTAGTASALTAPEAIHLVGAAGEPTFQDGTSNSPGGSGINFAPASFYKDHEGIVHLEGIVEVGTTAPGEIFTLPPGFRPASGIIQVFPNLENHTVFIGGSNTVVASLDISGEVLSGGAVSKPIVLSGITFRAQS